MICKNCGTSNSNNRTFCSYCGNNIDESRNKKNTPKGISLFFSIPNTPNNAIDK